MHVKYEYFQYDWFVNIRYGLFFTMFRVILHSPKLDLQDTLSIIMEMHQKMQLNFDTFRVCIPVWPTYKRWYVFFTSSTVNQFKQSTHIQHHFFCRKWQKKSFNLVNLFKASHSLNTTHTYTEMGAHPYCHGSHFVVSKGLFTLFLSP